MEISFAMINIFNFRLYMVENVVKLNFTVSQDSI